MPQLPHPTLHSCPIRPCTVAPHPTLHSCPIRPCLPPPVKPLVLGASNHFVFRMPRCVGVGGKQ
eukprot:6550476-Prymnesium_polylepis.1